MIIGTSPGSSDVICGTEAAGASAVGCADEILQALTVVSMLALGGAARGGSGGKGDDGGERTSCHEVTLTTLKPGDAACPFGGVKIAVPACSGSDRDKDEEGKGKPQGARGNGGHDAGDQPKVAFVCNGAPGTAGPAGPP